MNNVDDFAHSKFRNMSRESDDVPYSCCVRKDGAVVSENQCEMDAKADSTKSTDYLNAEGCFSKIEKLVLNNSTVLLGVSLGIVGLELLVLICGICFCKSVKDDK